MTIYLRGVTPPVNFVYPTITLDQARARGESAASLEAVANWNEAHAKGATKFRRSRQANELRRVAAALRGMTEQVAA